MIFNQCVNFLQLSLGFSGFIWYRIRKIFWLNIRYLLLVKQKTITCKSQKVMELKRVNFPEQTLWNPFCQLYLTVCSLVKFSEVVILLAFTKIHYVARFYWSSTFIVCEIKILEIIKKSFVDRTLNFERCSQQKTAITSEFYFLLFDVRFNFPPASDFSLCLYFKEKQFWNFTLSLSLPSDWILLFVFYLSQSAFYTEIRLHTK